MTYTVAYFSFVPTSATCFFALQYDSGKCSDRILTDASPFFPSSKIRYIKQFNIPPYEVSSVPVGFPVFFFAFVYYRPCSV